MNIDKLKHFFVDEEKVLVLTIDFAAGTISGGELREEDKEDPPVRMLNKQDFTKLKALLWECGFEEWEEEYRDGDGDGIPIWYVEMLHGEETVYYSCGYENRFPARWSKFEEVRDFCYRRLARENG